MSAYPTWTNMSLTPKVFKNQTCEKLTTHGQIIDSNAYNYIFYNTSPEYPTKVKLEKEELQSLRDLRYPKAEKDAENKESTLFEPLKFKLGALGGARGIRTLATVTPVLHP